jgi:hypothetical protein
LNISYYTETKPIVHGNKPCVKDKLTDTLGHPAPRALPPGGCRVTMRVKLDKDFTRAENGFVALCAQSFKCRNTEVTDVPAE